MNIALITSTIAPSPGVFALKVINNKERLAEYKKAFSFYCDMLKQDVFDKIVYVDNSGYSLEELYEIAIKKEVLERVEFISYKCTIDVTKNSRFYLEINLIDYFFRHFNFLNDSMSCTVWKVSGRYLIHNIDKIIRNCYLCGEHDLYINCRDYPYKVVDFYLVGLSLKSYQYVFSDNLDLYKGTRNGELILREFLDKNKSLDIKIMRNKILWH